MVYRDNFANGGFIKEELVRQGTRFLGYYKNGYASGTFWAGMLGGEPYGHLHGTIQDANGIISGNNISYIYPDMETALVGKFEDRTMLDAKHLKVFEVKCNSNGIPYVHTFTQPEMSIKHTFYYEAPTNKSFGAGPMGVLDPYENSMAEMRVSKIPNAGDGVFIKKNVTKNMVVLLYSGFYYDKEQHNNYILTCGHNITKNDDERRHCFKYSLGIDYIDKVLYIPPELDSPKTFFPTIGPKVSLSNIMGMYILK